MKKLNKKDLEKRALLISANHQGVHPPFEAFYLHSILYSAQRCLNSFERYEKVKNTDIPAAGLISLVQEAVGHAAALSRYFWPSVSKRKGEENQQQLRTKRGKKLRLAYDLKEDSPLHDRKLRNAWEHFDERLDRYLLGDIAGMMFPSCIVGSHILADDPVGHIFKLLDTEAECLVLLNQKFYFSPIRKEVHIILEKTNKFSNEGSRLPHGGL